MKLIRTSEFPYHVYNRTNNREFFELETDVLWSIFMKYLGETQLRFNCVFHAFVLMANHYHMIISTPLENLDQAMQYLQREVAKAANRRSNRMNHLFGGRYQWTVIGSENHYWNSVKYVFRNPVKAQNCSRVCDYQYSSLNTPAGSFVWQMVDFFTNQKLPIELDREWLNEPFLNEHEAAIQKALRRRVFKLPVNGCRKATILPAMQRKK